MNQNVAQIAVKKGKSYMLIPAAKYAENQDGYTLWTGLVAGPKPPAPERKNVPSEPKARERLGFHLTETVLVTRMGATRNLRIPRKLYEANEGDYILVDEPEESEEAEAPTGGGAVHDAPQITDESGDFDLEKAMNACSSKADLCELAEDEYGLGLDKDKLTRKQIETAIREEAAEG